MTTEEYKLMEREALDDLQRLHTLGINGNNIVFVMSRDAYLAALAEVDTVRRAADYSEDGEQTGIRSVYQGYDIFIINEETRSTFQPAIKGFRNGGVGYDQLSLGDLVLSETADEDPHIYSKTQLEPLAFNDTGLTVRRQYERVANRRVTFEDRLRAGQERERRRREMYTHLYDWASISGGYYTPRAPFETPVINLLDQTVNDYVMEEVRQCLKGKKAPPAKDWDERITPEDTKELDEFLNSLARKGALESAT